MGANTLTNLVPDLYSALDVVSREMVGFIPSVTRDSTVDRAALNQNIRSFVAPAATSSSISPGVTPPDDGDQTIGNVLLQITKAKRVPFRWNGEQTLGMNNGGPGAAQIRVNQIAQAMRTLCNEMEADLGNLYVSASRAYGTAATDPFASTLQDTAGARQILTDNGAPMSDLQLIINPSAGAKMRTLTQLTKANEAADASMLRQGVLLDVHGFAIRESAGVARPASGTGASATTNTAGYAVGATAITIASAGTGTIVAGDVITFAGDTNKYVVASGDTDVSNGGTLTLVAPGLMQALPASAQAITVVARSARNMAFARTAIVLANRLPALPDGGDMAVDRTLITDPRSGISFEIAMYAQYRQMQYEISAAWGVAMVKPEHCAVLLGG
jgi:hypothetical protein